MPSNPIDIEFLNNIRVEALCKNNWLKFEQLFGTKGACGNCWCMYFRLKKSDFIEGKFNEGNKDAIQQLVFNDYPTGILAFYGDEPIAWCALAPRDHFLKLGKSRVHKPIDDKKVWSIPCFFIAKNYRRLGVSVQLLKKVIEFARENDIHILEAYPTIPTTEKLPDSFAWIGLYKSFERAGFKIVDQTSINRPMVRYYLTEQ